MIEAVGLVAASIANIRAPDMSISAKANTPLGHRECITQLLELGESAVIVASVREQGSLRHRILGRVSALRHAR
jgi:hypothetical protein